MAFRILRWMAFLVVVLTAAGGSAAYWIWGRADELLRDRAEHALATHLPHWNVSFGEFEFDTDGTVRFLDVTLASAEGADEILHIPNVVVRVDRDLLLRHEQLVIQTIELQQPTVLITRSGAGDWNWQQLAPFPRTERACPEITIRQGTVRILLDRTEQMPATEFVFHRVDARLVPSAFKQFHIEAQTNVDYAGALVLEGSLDLNTSAWELRGQANAVNTQDGLLEMAAGLSTELRQQMEGFANNREESDRSPAPQLANGPTAPNVLTAAGHEEMPILAAEQSIASHDGSVSQFRLPELGLAAEMAVEFAVSREPGDSSLSYSIDAEIHDGQIINDALPMPLFGLQGHVSINDSEIVIAELSAGNDRSEVSISGRVSRDPENAAKDLTVKVVDLEIARSAQRYLHLPQLSRAVEMLSPAGRFNLDVRVQHDGADEWDVTLNEFTALGCSMMYEKFQYPVTDMTGSVRQQDDRFVVNVDGQVGGRPIAIRGYMRNPGPEVEMALTAEVDNFPIDDRFTNALQQENQQPARRTIAALALRGQADVDAEMIRRPGPDQPYLLKLDTFVHDASMSYEKFPYELTELQGRVLYDPLTEKVWFFRDLQAKHDNTVLSGAAAFDLRSAPGRLDLTVSAMQARLDEDLRAACVAAKPALGELWGEIRPSGLVDAHNISLSWQPGGALTVAMPSIQLSQGRFNLASHPYAWNDVIGSFAWRGNRVTIETMEAFHGDTFLSINGHDQPDSAFIDIAPNPNIAWNLHLEDVRLRKVSDQTELRRALPESLAKVLELLNLQGSVDVDLGIDLKASSLARGMVTAHWEMVTALSGVDLFLGVNVQNAHGQIRIVDGVWDGNAVTVDGYVNLTSVEAFGMPFQTVHGPFAVDGERLTLGAPNWPEWLPHPPLHSPDNPFAGHELQVDDLYSDEDHEGRLGINAVALLGNGDPEQVEYRVDMALRSASLKAWARDQEIRERLDGSVSGALSLTGYGTSERNIRGGGWVHVLSAELYESPLLVRIFNEISFEPPRARTNDKSAFHYAAGYFTIHDGLFDFSEIELSGEVIDLVGWGNVSFAEANSGELDMHFLTEVRNRIPGFNLIPVLSQAAEMFGKHWLHVSVTGSVQQPRARTEPRPPAVLTDPIRSVMEALGAGELVQPRRDRPLVPQGLAPRGRPPATTNPA